MSEHPNSQLMDVRDSDGLIRLRTDEENAIVRQRRLHREAIEREAIKVRNDMLRKQRRNRRIKKVVAATALLASVKSGGLIDMAGDAFSDAGSTVAGAIQPSRIEIPDEMDGIRFEDYSKKVRKEVIAERTRSAELRNDARAAVVDIFTKIDSEGTDWLVADVAALKAAHPENFVDSERSEQVKEAIDAAQSNADALSELDSFMNDYGIHAGFSDGAYDDKQSQTKKALKAYVNVFSVLPKDFVALSQLEMVTVSGKTVQRDEGDGESDYSVRGSYLEYDNLVTVYVDNMIETAAFAAADIVPNVETSYEQTIAHELGHAIDFKMPVGAVLETHDGLVEEVKSHASRIINGAIDRPEVPSMYSREDSLEYTAELLSGLLSDSEGGLVMPNEWRRFGSGSNLAMIDMLADIETQYPGITKILIANRL